MGKRSFRIALLVVAGLIVVGASADAATGGEAASGLGRLVCSVLLWAHGLVN